MVLFPDRELQTYRGFLIAPLLSIIETNESRVPSVVWKPTCYDQSEEFDGFSNGVEFVQVAFIQNFTGNDS